jgi:hypothetical protein
VLRDVYASGSYLTLGIDFAVLGGLTGLFVFEPINRGLLDVLREDRLDQVTVGPLRSVHSSYH